MTEVASALERVSAQGDGAAGSLLDQLEASSGGPRPRSSPSSTGSDVMKILMVDDDPSPDGSGELLEHAGHGS